MQPLLSNMMMLMKYAKEKSTSCPRSSLFLPEPWERGWRKISQPICIGNVCTTMKASLTENFWPCTKVQYSSKNPEFPYSSYPKFDYGQMDESERAEFRVRKQDIALSANVLQLPATIRCPQRTTNLWPNWRALYASEVLLMSMSL